MAKHKIETYVNNFDYKSIGGILPMGGNSPDRTILGGILPMDK